MIGAARVSMALCAVMWLVGPSCQHKQVANDCARFVDEAPVMEAPSAGCAVIAKRRLLVVRKVTPHPLRHGKLTPPGGGVEDGESAQCAAARETWEEAGVRVRVGRLLHRFPSGFHLFHCEPLDAAAGAAVTDGKVPYNMRHEASEKLLLEPVEMKNERGQREQWAFPSNRLIGQRWPQWVAQLAAPATPI